MIGNKIPFKFNKKDNSYVLQGAVKVHAASATLGVSADWRDLKHLDEPVLNGANMEEYNKSKYRYFRIIIVNRQFVDIG
jgi:hypothetical protein